MLLRHAVREHGGVNAAARALEIPRATFQERLEKETGGITRIAVIGDSHDKPRRTKEHYTWMGRYVADEDPDCVVHIGDFMSLDSLSMHEPKGSKQDREATTFPEDLDSLDEALGAYHKGVPYDCGIPHHITMGNHEDRAWRAAENDPRHMVDAPLRIQEKFAQWRWTYTDFKKWHFISGVGFTHVPTNLLGRPVGGKNSCNTIANEATHSIVFGHTHRFDYKTAAKYGARPNVQVLNVGSAMPDGTVETYFPDTSPTGFTYGVVLIAVDRAGNIISHSLTNMRELELRYG